jgi:U3 small nucleolar RNA-associated protein 13
MKIITNHGDGDGSIGSGDDEDRDDASNASNYDGAPESSPQISKTWTALTTHSPCYTGGTVAFSHSPSATTIASATAPAGDDGRTSSSSSRQHFILAQRGGDVSIIEASTGLLLRTVRKGKLFQSDDYNENNGEDEDEDDEEVMDAEAITAFALSPNNVDLIAVTRSHLVRKYSLAAPAVAAIEGEGPMKKVDGKQSRNSNGGKKEMSDEPLVQSVTSITDPAKVTFSFGKSGHTLPVTKVAFHPSGIFFATGSVDGLVKIWDVRNGYATHALHPTSSDGGGGGSRGRYAVTCLEWRATTTSLILAIGREDGSISIHDLLLNAHDTKTASLPVAVLRDHLSAVTSVTWTSEVGVINAGGESPASASNAARRHGGGFFFSSGRDSVINTWFISEEEVADMDGPKRKKKKTSGGDNNQQRQVSIIKVSYRRIRTLPIYEQVESMILLSRKFRPASETKRQNEILDKKDVVLATCGTKGIVRLWKATRGDGAGGIQSSISDLSLLATQSNEEAFGEGNGGYTSLHLTSLSTTHLIPMLVAIDAEHNMAFLRLQWADDRNALDFATDRAIVGHNGEILDLSVIPQLGDSENNDKHRVAVATNSSQVRIFGLEKAKEDGIGEGNMHHSALSPRGLLDGHSAIVLSIDASPCGRYLVTASKDKTMRLWHISSKKCLAVATGHTEAIGSVALSNKVGCYDVGGKAAKNGAGAFAVTASKDRTLKVWPLPGSAVLTRWADGGDGEHPLNARLSARAHEKVSAVL